MAADNSLTKKAHISQRWTEEQLNDMRNCINPENGHIFFATKFFYIQHPKMGKVLFKPYDYQLRLLQSYHEHRFSVNLLPRQSGKCLKGDTTMIKIRNKTSGEELEITIKDFYDMQAKQNQE